MLYVRKYEICCVVFILPNVVGPNRLIPLKFKLFVFTRAESLEGGKIRTALILKKGKLKHNFVVAVSDEKKKTSQGTGN